nr:hypothetical protein [Tanacetum cinerariifolium]
MESTRSHFFNDAELSSKKSVWVKWKHALASKDKCGLGVASLFALNRALMFKWKVKSCYPSLWLDIIHEVEMFKSRGIDLVSLIHSKLGNGAYTKMIDDFMLPEVSSKTRWIKAVPIKWQNNSSSGNYFALPVGISSGSGNFSSRSGNFFWQWEHITGSGKTTLEVGMDRTFNSQQSSPKLDAASAIRFLELNAIKSQQSSHKLDVQLLNLQVFLFLCFFLSSLHLPI